MSPSQHGGIIFRLLALFVFFGFLAGLYLVRQPLLRLAGNFWVVEDPLEHADAIVVIGDDNFAGDRASRAAELFRSGWAPQVVASGRMLRSYAGIAELIEHDLESRGVPATAVVRFAHHGDNTSEEAEALRGFVVQRGWHHILLVTSNYHTRRARYIFRRVFPASVSVDVVPAQDSDFDPDTWWESRRSVKIVFYETLSLGVAVWELRGAYIPSGPAQGPTPSPAALQPSGE